MTTHIECIQRYYSVLCWVLENSKRFLRTSHPKENQTFIEIKTNLLCTHGFADVLMEWCNALKNIETAHQINFAIDLRCRFLLIFLKRKVAVSFSKLPQNCSTNEKGLNFFTLDLHTERLQGPIEIYPRDLSTQDQEKRLFFLVKWCRFLKTV